MHSSKKLNLPSNENPFPCGPLIPCRSICEIWEKNIRENPETIAIKYGDISLSYKELDEKSTQLARFLKVQGVASGDIVALSMRHNHNLIIGALGILKAGGVYCPIDPGYPITRFNHIMSDARPILLLTEDNIVGTLPAHACKTILIEQCWEKLHFHIDLPLIDPTQLAYLIYTSGSTGAPKGIMIQHSSVTQSLLVRKKFYPQHPISLLIGSISFDASILIIFYTLAVGGTICLPKNADTLNITKIIEFVNHNSVNFILCVPQAYELILRFADKFESLECVSLAGDVIPGILPSTHAQVAPNALLYNDYGPSECAIGATIATIYDPQTKQTHKITIGKPLPGVEIYLLDERLNPVPIGDKGEIYIGGSGLASGYLNKPDLSAEKFLMVSLPGQKAKQLYRTGDYGRLLPDGNLDFLGRLDHQVKIRGHRIEFGEVEHVVCEHPEINAAIALAVKDVAGHNKLALYFSTASQESFSGALRTYLADKLPPYMVPSLFIQIKEWPQTPNGKIDRKALYEQFSAHITTSSEVPFFEEGSLESSLLAIWSYLLGHNELTIHHNFFELGGDSLQLANMQVLIEEKFSINISTTDLFENPTIFKLTQYISHSRQDRLSTVILSRDSLQKRKAAFQNFKKKMTPKQNVPND
jgi:amino acid adenylation domain-containing protein